MHSKKRKEKTAHHTYKEPFISPTLLRSRQSSNGTSGSTSNGPATFTLPSNIVPIMKSAADEYGPLVSPFPKNDFDLCRKMNFMIGNDNFCWNCKENLRPAEYYGTRTSSAAAARPSCADVYYEQTATRCTCPPPPGRTCSTRSLSPPTTPE